MSLSQEVKRAMENAHRDAEARIDKIKGHTGDKADLAAVTILIQGLYASMEQGLVLIARHVESL